MARSEERVRTAIVVGRQDFGETDRILRLLVPEEGRVSALARSARKKLGSIDVGARVQVALHHGHGDLDTLSRAELEDGRAHLRTRLGALALGLYACELCASFARAGHPEPRLYGLLETTLLLLDAATEEPGPALLSVLEAKVLTFAGLTPVLDRCAVCGGAPEPPLVFATSAGGLAHARCAGGEPVSLAFVRALEAGRRAPLQDSLDLRLPDDPGNVPYVAIRAHLGRELPARAMIAALAG